MAKRYLPVDRDQPYLLPPSVQDFVPEDDLAWFLIDAVAVMDTTVFHARARLGGRGRAGYDPDMLLTLLIYAYCLGQRSSRRIEQLCVRDLGFKVVTGNRVVDHTTIAEFRREHEAAVRALFVEVLVLCAKAGLGQVGLVAVDGTKMAAAAGLSRTRERETLAREYERLNAEVQTMLAEATATDAAQDALFGPGRRGDELPAALRRKAGRLARLREALAQIDRARAEHAAEHAAAHAAARTAAGQKKRDEVTKAQHKLDREIALRDQRLAKEAAAGGKLPGSRPDHAARIAAAQAELAAAQAAQAAQAQPAQAQPATDLAPQPGTDLAPQPATDLAPQPGTDLAPQPGTDLAPQPGTDLAPQPATATRGKDDLPSAARQGNATDPDSRVLKTAKGWIQGYNSQVASYRSHGLRIVLAAEVTQDANDVHQAVPMAAAATANAEQAGLGTIDLIVYDAGYWSQDNLTAPGPDRLIAPGKHRTMLTELRATGYTTGDPPPDAGPADLMRHRLKTQTGAETYAQRAPTVEPVFGHHKHNLDITTFHRRGLPAADSEWKLIHTAGNLHAIHRHQHRTKTRQPTQTAHNNNPSDENP